GKSAYVPFPFSVVSGTRSSCFPGCAIGIVPEAGSMKPEQQDPSEGPQQDQPEEIGDFSLLGYGKPGIRNGVEGGFLGVKASAALRLESQPPSDMNANDSPSNAEKAQTGPSLWSIRLRYSTGDGGRNCAVEIL